MEFSKYHGSGNDFLIVWDQEVSSQEAIQLCHRNVGVGADGVIILRNGDVADFRFDLINADGTPAEVSGNGLRCVARYLRDKGKTQESSIKVEAAGEVKVLEIVEGDLVRVDMGHPVDEGSIELYGLTWRKVNTGNPHVVTFVQDVDSAPVETLGPTVEHDPNFPDRTNVHFVKVDGDVLTARFWERGVGVTLACGTGSVASVAASGLKKATVRTLGGELIVEIDETGRAFLTGPAVHVFDGVTP